MPTIKFRKRTPKPLIPFIGKTEILKTFDTQKAKNEFEKRLNSATLIVKTLDDTDTISLILPVLLPDYSVVQTRLDSDGMRYDEAIKYFLEDSEVSSRVTKQKEFFYLDILPATFNHVLGEKNPALSSINSLEMREICNAITSMPNLVYKKYKYMSIEDVLKLKHIPMKHKNSARYSNNQVKKIRSLSLYGRKTGLFELVDNIQTLRQKENPRDDREAVDAEDIKIVINELANEYASVFKVLYLTGMRPSELFKATVHDGVFDLTKSKEDLKTIASYRIIPIHSSITKQDLANVNQLKRNKSMGSITSKINYKMKKLGIEGTTYSLRHSFASHLIEQDADANVVSELMGHSHKTMTLSRYAKGYSLDTLKNTVEKLQL